MVDLTEEVTFRETGPRPLPAGAWTCSPNGRSRSGGLVAPPAMTWTMKVINADSR